MTVMKMLCRLFKFFLLFGATCGLFFSFYDKPAFKVFDKSGKEVQDFDALIKGLSEADVILFGELHNNPVSHWLELEVARALYNTRQSKLVMGGEMFEADNQLVINEYLHSKADIDAVSNVNNWDNFKTDYQPLLGFAQKNSVSFIATNIPKRYASMVAHHGFDELDSLADESYQWIAPLPIKFNPELPAYKKMQRMMGSHGHMGLDPQNMVKAQAIKDATMAYFINQNLDEGHAFLHFNGNFHSKNYEGIYWYLKQYNKSLNVKTIGSVEQKQLDSLQKSNKKMADYIIVTPKNMTKTY